MGVLRDLDIVVAFLSFCRYAVHVAKFAASNATEPRLEKMNVELASVERKKKRKKLAEQMKVRDNARN